MSHSPLEPVGQQEMISSSSSQNMSAHPSALQPSPGGQSESTMSSLSSQLSKTSITPTKDDGESSAGGLGDSLRKRVPSAGLSPIRRKPAPSALDLVKKNQRDQFADASDEQVCRPGACQSLFLV